MTMIQRFQGERGKQLLFEAVKAQKIVGHDDEIARALAGCVELRQLSPGEILIRQGAPDNDLFLILTGRLMVSVNGREVASMGPGMHVGEMALLDTAATRSATVVATEQTLVGVVSEVDFSRIANAKPQLWRAVAVELGNRLDQRRRFLIPPNEKPVIFIGSSKENLPIASAIKNCLVADDVNVVLWNQGVFGASNYPLEDLEAQLASSDFAVLVAGADDLVVTRGHEVSAPRDNVIFELGLFMGALTRKRTFLVVPQAVDLKIPTDILGLTSLRIDSRAEQVSESIGRVCEQLRTIVLKIGPR